MIKIENFAGMSEAVSPRLLDPKFAVKAVNCRVDSGALAPIRMPSAVSVLPISPKTIFRYAGSHWFTWAEDVDVAKASIAYDVTDRVYFTGTGYPKQTRNDIALGAGSLPANSYRVGVPVPATVVSPTITGAADPDQAGLETDVFYTVTFVTAWGEEGPPANPSSPVTITDGQEVTLSLPSAPSGNYNLGSGARMFIYRSLSGSSETAFQFLAEVPIGTATFVDTTVAAMLGEVMPSLNWDAPPDDDTSRYPSGQMRGIRALPNGVMVGFSGKTLVYSEPYLGHAWPYTYPLKDEIVAIELTSNGVLVTTKNKPVLAMGLDPRAIAIEEIDESRACVSKRSMVDMGEYALYAGKDGLIGIEGGTTNLMTDGLFTRDQWQRFAPETISAYHWEGRYVAFYNNNGVKKGFMFKPGDPTNAFIELDYYADAGFYDAADDVLYLAVGDQLMAFDGGAVANYTWRSKLFYHPTPTNYTAIQVIADSYPITVELFRDTVSIPLTITSGLPQRIPSGRGSLWQIEIRGSSVVHTIGIAQSMRELADV